MFDKIKKYFLHKHIAAKKPDKIRVVCALEKAASVGIICEITDEDSYKAIFKIFLRLARVTVPPLTLAIVVNLLYFTIMNLMRL